MKRKTEVPFIFSITGTKGKTTVSRLISHALVRSKVPTLLVDSDGHYFNGRKKSEGKTSVILHSSAPTVCPGKYLYELRNKGKSVAVLETSIGSAGNSGLGYRRHNVAVFTNVFEDHFGRNIKTKKDIAERKGRISFGSLPDNGFAVFNADDSFVVGELVQIPEDKNITQIPFGINFNELNLEKHLDADGVAIIYNEPYISLKTKDAEKKLLDVRDISWTFNGQFTPSIYNLQAALGALLAYSGGKNLTQKTVDDLATFKIKKTGGRLVTLRNKKKNIDALLDFAHEKYSIIELAKLAKSRTEGKVVAIVRFATDRTNEQLEDYASAIAPFFDSIVVYDKIDGVVRKPISNKKHMYYRDIGEVADIVYKKIGKTLGSFDNTFKEIEEKNAIAKALSLAESGDLLVHISNDHKKSVQYFKQQGFR